MAKLIFASLRASTNNNRQSSKDTPLFPPAAFASAPVPPPREYNNSNGNNYNSSYNASAANYHPFSSMTPAPLPVVSNQLNEEDEACCPVCLEPLSFSFRLPGEKPHIVPECGHALHEVLLFHAFILSPSLILF